MTTLRPEGRGFTEVLVKKDRRKFYPKEASIFWTLQRYTAVGTATVAVPVALDSADPASVGVSGENRHSVFV